MQCRHEAVNGLAYASLGACALEACKFMACFSPQCAHRTHRHSSNVQASLLPFVPGGHLVLTVMISCSEHSCAGPYVAARFDFSWGDMEGADLLGHRVSVSLIHGSCPPLPKAVTLNVESSGCPTSLPTRGGVSLLIFSLSGGYVASQCGFNSQFPGVKQDL